MGLLFLLFCWVVPLGLLRWVLLRFTLSPFTWCCLPSIPFGGAAFSLLFSLGGVAWPPSLSGVALFPFLLRGAAFLSPPSLGGALSKRKFKKNEKNDVKNKK